MLGGAFRAVNARLGKRAVIWAAAAALLAIVLDFVPLFDLLGYDFSFAMGLLATLASVDIGAGAVQMARRRGPALDVARTFVTAAVASAALLLLPLLLSLVNAARVRNCNVTGGLAVFALLPLGSALYGAGAGVLAATLFPRRGRLVAFLLPALSVAWTLWRLCVAPAVFTFAPFGGYFPGPIYDEAMRVPARLAGYRGVNLLWLSCALAITHAVTPAGAATWQARRWRRGAGALAVLLLAPSLARFAARGALRFHVRKADLLRVLDGERHSNRIVLRYPVAGSTPADLALTMDDLEFRYDQLREILGVEPAGPITVYSSRTPRRRRRWSAPRRRCP